MKEHASGLSDSAWTFNGWTQDISGSDNPVTVVIGGDVSVTASFDAVVITGFNDIPSLTRLTVRQNWPNPFTGGTQIDFGLPAQADVVIEVDDVAGRRVFDERVPLAAAGWNTFFFAGRDATGQALPSGVYFYKVRSAREVTVNKMVIVR